MSGHSPAEVTNTVYGKTDNTGYGKIGGISYERADSTATIKATGGGEAIITVNAKDSNGAVLSSDSYTLEVVDKTVLAAKIADVQGLVESTYTAGTWAALQTALSAAVAVNSNSDATQPEVVAALDNLQSAITGFSVQGPSVTMSMSTAGSVQPGDTFIVVLGLSHIIPNIYAEDITLSYDPTLFEYVKTEGVGDSGKVIVVSTNTSTSGALRIIAANNGGIAGDAAILNIGFKVKNGILISQVQSP